MTEETVNTITDMYLDGFSYEEISKTLKTSVDKIRDIISKLLLDKYHYTKISRPQDRIYKVMSRVFGVHNVKQEHPVGHSLRLDIYIPTEKIAIEYHGEQHFKYIPFFHKNKDSFLRSQYRDRLKESICSEQGICLVVFKPKDPLDENSILERIALELLKNVEKGSTHTVDPEIKQEVSRSKALYKRAKEYRRNYYKSVKSRLNNGYKASK